MENLEISLSDDLSHFVASQAQIGGLAGPSEYVLGLVAKAKRGSELVEALLLDGLESGPPVLWNSDARDAIRRQVDAALRR